jgi:hypothetical protein
MNSARQLVKLDGEVRILHLPGQRVFKTALESGRRVNIQLHPGKKCGSEEWKPLNVVPVRVTDQKINAMGTRPRPQEIKAKLANTGTTVKNDEGAVGGSDLDT